MSSVTCALLKTDCFSSVELPLNERVEYLAIALMHAKSSATQPEERAPVDFVSNLEDLADVANVQMDIWQTIANAGETQGMDADVRVAKVQGLEKGLLTVQQVSPLGFRACRCLTASSFMTNMLCRCTSTNQCSL